MKISALRRNPQRNDGDPYCHKSYGNDKASLHKLLSQSDYILVSAPLTDETKGLIDAEALECARAGAVFINVGRGPIVDENALIECLKNGKLKGAALDVFDIEPLPVESELWELDNVLISP